jgi:uncharacterized protein YqhQ
MMVSRLRYGKRENENKVTETKTSKFNFEAERMLRVVVIALLVVSFILYPELLWFVPWFIGVMLLLAGITKICPMVIFFHYLGFR